MTNEQGQRISVVICAYSMERLPDVQDAVRSVLDQTMQPHEVIVSVDHNEDVMKNLGELLPKQVKLVFNGGVRGLSETRNVGIRLATGDVIAFIDDDAVADRTWLQGLSPHFNVTTVFAAGGRIDPLWAAGGRPAFFPEELYWILGCTYRGMPVKGNQVRNLIGCNMAFRSQAFDMAGLFSTELGRKGKASGIGEDSEMCLRLSHRVPGSLVVYEPEAVVRHKVPRSRATLRYVIQRSYDEGFHKSTVMKLAGKATGKPLSAENAYLRYLMTFSIPQRLKRAYQPQVFLQLVTLLAGVSATGFGYLIGRIRNRRVAAPEQVLDTEE